MILDLLVIFESFSCFRNFRICGLVIYDFDLLHQVYPFQENEKRLTFVMNIVVNRETKGEWNAEKFKWEYTHIPHEKTDDRNNI